MKRLFCLYIALLTAVLVNAQNITGKIVDALTGDSIPFASLAYRGHHISIASNHAGRFTIERHQGWTLTFSAIGYKNKKVRVEASTPNHLVVRLESDSKQLGEVTVKTKRGKYRRKENPAVELMRRVIAAKKRTDLARYPFYEYHNYQKLTLAVNDVKPGDLDSGFFKNKAWLSKQVEMCEYNNKLILPLSVDETVTRKIYRKNPHSEKDIIIGQRSEGVNHVLQTGEILNTVAKDAFTDIDIYDNQIRVLRHPFTSPIGRNAIEFYRFYIVDTVLVDRDSCYHLAFLPNNQQDFGFRGDLYILADTTLHVKRCNMSLPKSSDVNFVKNMWIQQEYTKLDNGEWVLTTDDMIVELSLLDLFTKGIAIRTTRKTDYSFEPIEKKMFSGKQAVMMNPDALIQSTEFWQEARKVPLTKSEARMGGFIHDMQHAKGYKWILPAFKILVENFVETGSEKTPSKVDIGPINTIVSRNFIDGWRFRASALTTANLNPHWFLKGYYAYGTKSHKHYYNAKLTYTFNKKIYTPEEFPRRSVVLESTYDVMSPSDRFLTTDKDNVFTAFKWTKVDRMMFYNRQKIEFQYETDFNLLYTLGMKFEKDDPAGNMHFTPFRTTELTGQLRYAPGEKYMNTKQRRIAVNSDNPVYTISHTIGFNGFLGGQHRYNFTEASIYHRIWLNSWGKLDITLKGGVQWNHVPYMLLIFPAANLSYFSQENTFSMINNMEFLNDRYMSLHMAWDLKGKLFNRIPLLRKLKLREFIGFKTLWGGITDRNAAYLPEGSYAMNPRRPYAEFAIGVHNIFRILQIQYVRRINYNDLPTARKNGIRFMFNITF